MPWALNWDTNTLTMWEKSDITTWAKDDININNALTWTKQTECRHCHRYLKQPLEHPRHGSMLSASQTHSIITTIVLYVAEHDNSQRIDLVKWKRNMKE